MAAEAADDSLQHVNVRCLLDGRKFRIAASRDASAHDLAGLPIGTLHRRLAEQTSHPPRTFCLQLPMRTATTGGSGGRTARLLHATEIIGALAPTGKRSVLVEMAPFEPVRSGELPCSAFEPASPSQSPSRSNSAPPVQQPQPQAQAPSSSDHHHNLGHSSDGPLGPSGFRSTSPLPSSRPPRPQTTPRGFATAAEEEDEAHTAQSSVVSRSYASSATGGGISHHQHDHEQRRSSRSHHAVASSDTDRRPDRHHRYQSTDVSTTNDDRRSTSSVAGVIPAAPTSGDDSLMRREEALLRGEGPAPPPRSMSVSSAAKVPEAAAAAVTATRHSDPLRGALPSSHPTSGVASHNDSRTSTTTSSRRHPGEDSGRPGARLNGSTHAAPERTRSSRRQRLPAAAPPPDDDEYAWHPTRPQAASSSPMRRGSSPPQARPSGLSSSSSEDPYAADADDNGQPALGPSSSTPPRRDHYDQRYHVDAAAAQQQLDDAKYRLEVARALLEEDRVQWEAEHRAVERECARDVHGQLTDASRREEQLDTRVARLRDSLYDAEDELERVTAATADTLRKRDAVKKDVDLRAEQLDKVKRRFVQRLAAAGCDEEKDEAMIEKLVYLVVQKHMHRLQLASVHKRVSDESKRLDDLRYQRRTLHHTVEEAKGNIRVVVRMRPLLSADFSAPRHAVRDEEGALDVDTDRNTIALASPSTGTHDYEFYRVYGPPPAEPQEDESSFNALSPRLRAPPPLESQQQQLFIEQVQPLLQSLFDGVNIAVVAYGQTGSGKTHTIFGEGAADSGDNNNDRPLDVAGSVVLDGVLPQSLRHLFAMRDELEAAESAKQATRGDDELDPHQQQQQPNVQMRLSMVEVYQNDVFDVLSPAEQTQPMMNTSGRITTASASSAASAGAASGGRTLVSSGRRCEIRALPVGGAVVVGAQEVPVDSEEQAMAVVVRGFAGRKTHKTLTNARSSRSHLILTLYVEATTRSARSGNLVSRSSKLMFVDLAGSERVHKSLSSGDRLKEAQHINRSLSALGDVLAALTAKPRPVSSLPGGSSAVHVPYRNSKLTHLLQSCIGGSSKTLMFACICPHVPQRHNLGETASTLSFAARARRVENRIPLVHEQQRETAPSDGGGR